MCITLHLSGMRVLQKTGRMINCVGIDEHELTGLNVVTAAALLDTQEGPIIEIFHENAHLSKGRSIHAAGQMEWFHCKVDDRSKVVDGAQRIETSDRYVIPLSIESGLVYMHSIQILTDNDLQQYPHVFFTSSDTWDASVLDHGIAPSLPYLKKSTKKLMIPYFKIPFLMNWRPPTQGGTTIEYILGFKPYRIWEAYLSYSST